MKNRHEKTIKKFTENNYSYYFDKKVIYSCLFFFGKFLLQKRTSFLFEEICVSTCSLVLTFVSVMILFTVFLIFFCILGSI